MVANNFQGGTGTDGSTLTSRARAAGYPGLSVSENDGGPANYRDFQMHVEGGYFVPTVSVTGDYGRRGFVLTRTGDVSAALTVSYHVGGGAIGGVDYDTLSGVVPLEPVPPRRSSPS